MTRPVCASINLHALRHNLQRARAVAPTSRVMAIVKANAYGHGLVRVARTLCDANGFGVASLDEAIALREAGIKQRILLLEGFLFPSELELIHRWELDVVLHHPSQVETLEQLDSSVPLSAWLKLDTGMHRLGFAVEEFAQIWKRVNACPAVAQPVRVMTHLANADDRHDSTTDHQLRGFYAQVSRAGAELSIANSAGVLGWPAAHADWIRPGIMLYGISPFTHGGAADEGLVPVMTLSTRLIAVNSAKKGVGVGYGGTWKCPEDMRYGVAAIGYGDGYPRHAKSGTPVLVNGQRVPLIGRVSMDMLAVDLRTQPEAKPGDPVVLWGSGLPIEEVARWTDTIPYELVCKLTQRVKFSEENVSASHA